MKLGENRKVLLPGTGATLGEGCSSVTNWNPKNLEDVWTIEKVKLDQLFLFAYYKPTDPN